MQGHSEVVSLLLAAGGIKPNIALQTGATALHLAARWGHAKVLVAMLSSDCSPRVDVRAMSSRMCSPLLALRMHAYI
jgi:ankyrin repeat protein